MRALVRAGQIAERIRTALNLRFEAATNVPDSIDHRRRRRPHAPAALKSIQHPQRIAALAEVPDFTRIGEGRRQLADVVNPGARAGVRPRSAQQLRSMIVNRFCQQEQNVELRPQRPNVRQVVVELDEAQQPVLFYLSAPASLPPAGRSFASEGTRFFLCSLGLRTAS